MAVLIDTSAVVAAIDRADDAHASVVDALAGERSSILLPVVTLPEIAYLLEARHGASSAAAAMTRLVGGTWPVIDAEGVDLTRAAELMTRYADSRVGFVDAAIAATAERLGIARIYTLDRRDFAIIRPKHVDAFDVRPVQ